MKTTDRISRYKKKIQDFIKTYKGTPSHTEVLIHLLNTYRYGNYASISTFVYSHTRTHIAFAHDLCDKLSKPDFNLMKDLDNYLSSHKLEKDGDFFALWLAYFYYYKPMYGNLSEHENIKKQVIIPVHLLKERMLNDTIDLLITEISNKDANISLQSIIALRSTPIPKKKEKYVIEALLKRVIAGNIHVTQYEGRSIDKLTQDHFNSSKKKEISDWILPFLTKCLVNTIKAEVCKTIATLNIPEDIQQQVFTCLYQITTDESIHVRIAVWQALYKLGFPPIDPVHFDDLLKKMETDTYAWVKLFTTPIPDQKLESVIKQLLQLARHPKPYVSEYAFKIFTRFDIPKILKKEFIDVVDWGVEKGIHEAFLALPKTIFSDDRCEDIVRKMLKMIAEDNYNSHALDALDVLSKIKVPKKLQMETTDVLIILLETAPWYIKSEVLHILGDCVPHERSELVINKLLETATETDIPCLRNLAYTAIAKISIPPHMRENVFSIILSAIDNNYIDLSLSQFDFTPNARELMISKLLSKLTKQPTDPHNILRILLHCHTKSSLPETIAFCSKLESIKSDAPKEVSILISNTIRELDNLCATKNMVLQKLPDEIAENIMQYT